MNGSIAFWLDYLGGVSVAYIAVISVAGTQVIKMVSKSCGIDKPVLFRLVSCLLGALLGIEFIGGTQGPLEGFAIAGIASASYFALRQWLATSDQPWRVAVARYMSGDM